MNAPPSNSAATTSVRGWQTSLLLAILALAAALRMHHLTGQSFGFDELFSVHFATARGPWESAIPTGHWLPTGFDVQSMRDAPHWWQVWTSMGYDTHPPLYPMALRAWMAAFGESDASARSLSLVFSLLLILLVFDATRVAAGATSGLWAALLAAVAGPQIEFAQETRSYMMLTALAAGAMCLAVRMVILGETTRRIALFAFVAVVAMLTHYWAIAFLAPLAIVLLLQLPRAGKWRLLSACGAALLIFAIAWGPFLLQQRANFTNNMSWISDHGPGHFLRTVRKACVLPLRLLFAPFGSVADDAADGRGVLWLLPAMLYVAALLAVRRRPAAWVLTACFFGPSLWVGVMDLLTQRQTINLLRYSLPASAGLFPLLATCLAGARVRALSHAVPLCAAIGCLAALPVAWDGQKPHWRLLFAEATRSLGPSDCIVIQPADARHWWAATAYMALCRYTDARRPTLLVLGHPTDATALNDLPPGARILLISDQPDPPAGAWADRLEATPTSGWFPATGAYRVFTQLSRERP